MPDTVKQQARNRNGTFPKGVSGNPKGAPPKEWTWRQLIREALEEVDPDTGMEWRHVVINALRQKAKRQDVPAAKELGDRVDGKPAQAVEVSGPDGGPVQTNHTIAFVKS